MLKYEIRDNWHEKPCVLCGKIFTAKRSDAFVCSKKCGSAYWYSANGQKLREGVAAWRVANPDKCRTYHMNYRVKRKGWESDGAVSGADWTRTLNRFGRRCAYCGEAGDLQMEHVVPLSRGGCHTLGNVVPACAACNLSKHTKFLTEWRYHRQLIAKAG